MATHTLAKLLQDTPFFGGINDVMVQFILDRSNKIQRQTDEYFFREKELGDSMFLLISGSVKVVKFWHGNNYTLNTLFAGDCFGEMTIIEHNSRSASVLAMERCIALEISNQTFMELYHQDIKQFALLQMNMGREISRRLRSVNERLFQHYIRDNVATHHQQHFS